MTSIRSKLARALCRGFRGTSVIASTMLALGVATAAPYPSESHAQEQQQDKLELLNLATRRAGPRTSPGSIGFQVTLGYHLQTSPSGQVKLLLSEDDKTSPLEVTDAPIAIQAGSARIGLELDYSPRSDAESVRLIGQLYSDGGTLLDTFATVPLTLPREAGREQFNAAIAARDAGRPAQALELLTSAIQLGPSTGQFYYWRADTLVSLGRYGEAVQDYSTALEIMPRDRPSRVGRGIALVWLEQWGAAIDDLTAAIASEQSSDQWTAWAYRARGLAHTNSGNAAAARADFASYLRLRPDASDRGTVEGWIANTR